MDATTSIAIVGGGISGLVFAQSLADRGFSNVVIFEREREVGGKSCTIAIDGLPHDLGATMGVPIDYRPIVELSRAAQLPTAPFPPEVHYSLERRGPIALNRRHELPRVLAETARYLALHARTWRGDLHSADPSLFAPWDEVARDRGLETVSKRMLCYRTGYGYGFGDSVPAVMYANMLRPQTLVGLALGAPFMWRDGTQPIWKALATRLARRVEIRTGTAVTRIARDHGGVTVTTDGRRERFDRIVIACDPTLFGGVLDTSEIERAWFEQVQTTPYATFACEVEGLADGRAEVGYLDGNMRRDRAGHPMAWVKRHATTNICVFHLFAPPALPDAEIDRRIATDLARLGGRFVGTRASRRWRFFPHFSSAFMRAGGLAELDRWQGTTGAYLIGEVVSFSTMARVAHHAIDAAARLAREPSRGAVTVGLANVGDVRERAS